MAWMFLFRLLDGSLALVRTILLARLLSPGDLGLAGMAVLVLGSLDSLSAFGFDAALIRGGNMGRDYLDTAWSVQVVRGLALCLLGLALALPAGRAFGEAEIAPLIAVLALAAAVRGFQSVGLVHLRKELAYARLFVYNISASLANLSVSALGAWVLRSAWAVVLGNLALAAAGLVASYALHPYRPRFRADRTLLREGYQFSRWVWLGSVLVFLLLQGDDLFVGKVLGATALGLYQMAYLLSNLAATQITYTTEEVALPAYAEASRDGDRLRTAYVQVIQAIAFLSVPLTGLIAFFALPFTRLVLGRQWLPMVPALQILALWGMIRSVSSTCGSVFLAVGRPGTGPRLMVAKLALLAALIWPLSMRWGIQGAAIAVVLSSVAIDPVAVYVGLRLLRLPARSLARAVLLPLLNTALTIGILAGVRALLPGLESLLGILVLGGAGVATYLALVCACDWFLGYGMLSLVKSRLADLRPDGIGLA